MRAWDFAENTRPRRPVLAIRTAVAPGQGGLIAFSLPILCTESWGHQCSTSSACPVTKIQLSLHDAALSLTTPAAYKHFSLLYIQCHCRRRRRPSPPGSSGLRGLHRGDGPTNFKGRQPDPGGGRGKNQRETRRERQRLAAISPTLSPLITHPLFFFFSSLHLPISDARHHGHQRVRQVHAVQGLGRPPGLRGHGGRR